jgi:hypothetical protein
MAAKANIDAVAVRLRRAGLSGTLDQLRALALTDLTQGLDFFDRLIPAPAPPDGDRGNGAGHEHGEAEDKDDTKPDHSPGGESDPGGPGPDPAQAARLADLLRALNATTEPIAVGSCGHRHAEDRYTPSRKLRHLIRARTATCSAPGCGGQAVFCDLDHVVPYPAGLTCECNLHPLCRRHHRCKQAPGWHVRETQPGIMRWTTPAGRTHTTTPTTYDA